jgi:tetratricopeptide (TPR) repeat protein
MLHIKYSPKTSLKKWYPYLKQNSQSDQIKLLEKSSFLLNESLFDEAEVIALDVIKLDKNMLEAYRILAHLHLNQNNYKKGLEWIQKSLNISKKHASTYETQGIIFLKEKNIPQSKKSFKKALSLSPKNKKYLNYYTATTLELSDTTFFEEDVSFLKTIITKNKEKSPILPNLHFSLASIYENFSKKSDASNHFKQARFLGFKNKELAEIALSYYNLNNYEKTIQLIENSGSINELNLEELKALISSYKNTNKIKKSLKIVQQALKLFPNNTNLLITYAIILKETKAINEYENLLNYLDEKISDENNPLNSTKNEKSTIYNNIGVLEQEKGRIEKAINYYEKAIKLSPTNTSYYSNLGLAYSFLGKFELSIKLFEKALSLSPSSNECKFNLSIYYLLNSRFEEGFNLYLSRLKLNRFKNLQSIAKSSKAPFWKGENLTGKSLFIYSEQGLGDTIQFVRYLPWVIEKAETVFFFPNEILEKLISYNFNSKKIKIIKYNEITSHSFDFQIPLMNLPIVHKTNFHNIIAPNSYLTPPKEKQAITDSFKKNNSKLKIGFSWQGNPLAGAFRSIKLQKWLPLIDYFQDTADFYSLQKGPGEEQLNFSSKINNIIPLGHLFEDFCDTATAISKLDLVITIDSSIAHLSGALGKPTWILLPVANDWRWFLKRSDSPWYPSVTLFRREIKEEWSNVFKRVKIMLEPLTKKSYGN